MIISVRKIGSFLRFVFWFAALTLFFYYVLGLVSRWVAPPDPYRVPVGHAVKAFQPEGSPDKRVSPGDRLRLYYWYGE